MTQKLAFSHAQDDKKAYDNSSCLSKSMIVLQRRIGPNGNYSGIPNFRTGLEKLKNWGNGLFARISIGAIKLFLTQGMLDSRHL